MKKPYIILLVLLGIFFMPNKATACGGKNHSCKKEVSSKKVKDDCCKSKSNSKHKNSDGCGGKCGHSNCTSSTSINFSIISSYEINFKNNFFDFSEEKAKFYHSKTFISSGFYSIWLIPKIS